MIKNILFLQPPLLEEAEKHFENEILIWPVYLQNFLHNEAPRLKFDLLYLPIDLKNGGVSLKSHKDIQKLYSKLDVLSTSLNFELDEHSMILISGTTNFHFLISKIIAEYYQKYYKTSIILYGGAAASATPSDFNYDGSPVDYIVKGEGELSIWNLIKQNPKKKNSPQIIENNPVPDINKLPPIDFSIFENYIKNFNHLGLNLSRGCPFSCSFCNESCLMESGSSIKRWRCYAPSRAIEEFKTMVEFGVANNISEYALYDSIFALSKQWLEAFLKKFNFNGIEAVWTETRLDSLSKKMLLTLQKKHFYLWYGLESFSPRVLSIMNKSSNPKAFLNKFNEIYNINKELNNIFAINIIANFPGTTTQDEIETYNNLEQIMIDDDMNQIGLSLKKFHAFPGNPLYYQLKIDKSNMQGYLPQLNSTFYFPFWWKNVDSLKLGLYCSRPSRSLSLRKSLCMYFSHYKKLLKIQLENLKKNKPANFLQMAFGMKRQIEHLDSNKNELFDFLDQNNIELDEDCD